MTRYSINLGEEYKTLERLNSVKQFFIHRNFEDKYTEEIKKVEELEQTIIDRLLEIIKIYGNAILKDPDTEFGL